MTFAKIVIASDGEQVLFFKDEGDEGQPELVQMTAHMGITARLALGFETDEAGDAYEKRDAAFDLVHVGWADQVRASAKSFLE